MRRFRIATTLLLAVAALALLSCGKTEPGEQPRTTRITLWHIQTGANPGAVISDAVGRFEEEHPDVAVNNVPTRNDAYKDKLDRAMATGLLPDVFHTWGGGVLAEYVKYGRVHDLTEAIEAAELTKRVHPTALKFTTFHGKTYAVPMDVSVVVMWYNREIFRKHGVAVPKTFDDLKGACRKLRAAGVTPIALGNRDKWPGAFYYIYLAVRAGGKKPFDDAAARAPGATFEHPSFVKAGKRLRELIDLPAFNDGIHAAPYDNARALFVKEEAAMILMGTWLVGNVRSDLGDAADAFLKKIDFFEFPALDEGTAVDARIVVAGVNSAFAVSSTSRRTQTAFNLIEEFVSDLSAQAWAEKTGRIPALREQLVSHLLDRKTMRAARTLYDAPDVQHYYDQYLPRALGEAVNDIITDIFTGTLTPEQAAARMQQASVNRDK